MTKSFEECSKYNLDSVRLVFSGAAPLGEETVQDMKKLWPKWLVAQGYGEFLEVHVARELGILDSTNEMGDNG